MGIHGSMTHDTMPMLSDDCECVFLWHTLLGHL